MRQLAVALKYQVPRGEPGLLEERLAPALGPPHSRGALSPSGPSNHVRSPCEEASWPEKGQRMRH